MGTHGPAWFTSEFPAIAARRDPFPDVERWQTTYVRYSMSETAQPKVWEAESCRRNLQALGLSDHPLNRQSNVPESISMRIIEAPAEYALPVKQDRRLLPCFKVRLEVQHRGAIALPLTLRAHVLSQQDKEQITSWMPPDDAASRDDKGQKAATELKGTAYIRCTLEAGASGELRAMGMGAKDGQGQSMLPSGPSGGGAALRSFSDRLVKAETTYVANGMNGTGPTLLGGGGGLLGGGGLGSGGGMDAFHLGDGCGGLGSGGLLRDGSGGGLLGGPPGHTRDLGFSSLFAPNRPDPVVTLASSGRMSATGSNLPSLGSGTVVSGPAAAGSLMGVGSSGLRLGNGDAFDAAVEMLMQPSGQQQQHRRQGMLDGGLGGPKLLSEMQRQIQQQQQHDEVGQRQQLERGSGLTPGAAAGGHGGKLMTSVQDFEFTNLEFLKPTRMNKVFMAFTASIMDSDLLFVVFNVPTIGICRAEQREKACKKLHIDYRLLSHFDQGAERPPPATAAGAPSSGPIASSPMLSSVTGPAGPGPGPDQGALGTMGQSQSQVQIQGQMSMARLNQAKSMQQMATLQESKLAPQGSGVSLGPGVNKFGQMGVEGKGPVVSDTDYPRLMSGMGLQQPHQHHQPQQQQQQRMGDVGLGGGLAGAGGFPGSIGLGPSGGGAGMLGSGGGGMLNNGLAANGSPPGGLGNGGGMSLTANGLAQGMMMGGGLGGHGGMGGMGSGRLGSGVGQFGLGNGDIPTLGNPGTDFFFGTGGSGGGMGNGGPLGVALGGMSGGGGMGPHGGAAGMELGSMGIAASNSRKRDQGLKEDDNYRFQPVQPAELPPYQGFMGLTSSDVEMLLPAPHSRMAMRDFINEVYDGTGLHRKLTHMDMQALLSQAGFPMDSNREHDTISPQQWDEFCSQFRNIVNTLQQVASVWNMEDPVVISGFDMDRAGTITALVNEPAGTFICRFSMSQPGCLVLTCKVGVHPRADPMGLIHAIIKIDDLHERRVDTWIRDYAGATHLLDVYRQKRVDKRKVFATNYTRLRGLEVGEQTPVLGLGPGFM